MLLFDNVLGLFWHCTRSLLTHKNNDVYDKLVHMLPKWNVGAFQRVFSLVSVTLTKPLMMYMIN
jgi:hypothetical protein